MIPAAAADGGRRPGPSRGASPSAARRCARKYAKLSRRSRRSIDREVAEGGGRAWRPSRDDGAGPRRGLARAETEAGKPRRSWRRSSTCGSASGRPRAGHRTAAEGRPQPERGQLKEVLDGGKDRVAETRSSGRPGDSGRLARRPSVAGNAAETFKCRDYAGALRRLRVYRKLCDLAGAG